MKKFIFKLLDMCEELLTYFTLCVYFLLAILIAEAIPSLLTTCIIGAIVVYVLEHYKSKKGNEDEK